MNARLAVRLLKLAAPPKAKPGAWPMLSEPVLPNDTDTRIRAQSILTWIRYRDGSTQCPPLTLAQARDVISWNCQ